MESIFKLITKLCFIILNCSFIYFLIKLDLNKINTNILNILNLLWKNILSKDSFWNFIMAIGTCGAWFYQIKENTKLNKKQEDLENINKLKEIFLELMEEVKNIVTQHLKIKFHI